MNTLKNCLFALLLATLLTACGTAPKKMAPFEPDVLLAPASLGEHISLYQQVHVDFGHFTGDMTVALEVSPEKLVLVGMAHERRIVSASFDGTRLDVWRGEHVPDEANARTILTNLQLALWPADALNRAMPEGWEVTDDALVRQIRYKGDTIIRIEYTEPVRWKGKITMTDYRYHYLLTIDSTLL